LFSSLVTIDGARPRIDAGTLALATAELSARDHRLAALVERNGVPPLWERPEGFATLLRIILEQQVSLASAAAAYRRLETRLGSVEPGVFLRLNDNELLAVGFSRQKAGYCRALAAGLVDGSIDLGVLATLDDDGARQRLLGLHGVGPWTADVYVMFALGRGDVWPPGDRALLVALDSLLQSDPPTSAEGAAVAAAWVPWRSVAARILWHDYLGGKSGPM
jgi:DNA-3-methyladenine glycosylase II